MILLPIECDETFISEFIENPDCAEYLEFFRQFYKEVGFVKPWIGYFVANEHKEIVGVGSFKGKPNHGKIEISYATFSNLEGKGIGTEICRSLVFIARAADKMVNITARTLPVENSSKQILKKMVLKVWVKYGIRMMQLYGNGSIRQMNNFESLH